MCNKRGWVEKDWKAVGEASVVRGGPKLDLKIC